MAGRGGGAGGASTCAAGATGGIAAAVDAAGGGAEANACDTWTSSETGTGTGPKATMPDGCRFGTGLPGGMRFGPT